MMSDCTEEAKLPVLVKNFEDVSDRFLLSLRRSNKSLDESALIKMQGILDEFYIALSEQKYVPRLLAGDMWNVFGTMLFEANYVQDERLKKKIEAVAWDIEMRLLKIFGGR